MASRRASSEAGVVVVTHDGGNARGFDSPARLCMEENTNQTGAGMRIPSALIHKPSAFGAGIAQCAEELRALRRKGGKAVQVGVPSWFPVKVTKEVRCYILGFRLHHGLTGSGCVIVGTVLRKLKLVLLGAVLCLHDKEDWPWPITT